MKLEYEDSLKQGLYSAGKIKQTTYSREKRKHWFDVSEINLDLVLANAEKKYEKYFGSDNDRIF